MSLALPKISIKELDTEIRDGTHWHIPGVPELWLQMIMTTINTDFADVDFPGRADPHVVRRSRESSVSLAGSVRPGKRISQRIIEH